MHHFGKAYQIHPWCPFGTGGDGYCSGWFPSRWNDLNESGFCIEMVAVHGRSVGQVDSCGVWVLSVLVE